LVVLQTGQIHNMRINSTMCAIGCAMAVTSQRS
jgi:hypothetical protein